MQCGSDNTSVTTYYSTGTSGMKEEKEGLCVCNAIFQLVCLWFSALNWISERWWIGPICQEIASMWPSVAILHLISGTECVLINSFKSL